MAENQQMPQTRFIPHAAESKQRTEGFSGAGACKDKHILSLCGVDLESTSHQLNQLLLPLSRLDSATTAVCRQREGRGFDNGTAEDESF